MADRVSGVRGGRGDFLRRLALCPVEIAWVLAVFAIYYVGRSLPADRPGPSADNALRIIDLERRLGIFREAAWNHFAIERPWLSEASEFTYTYLHLPTLAAVGFLMYLFSDRRYRVLRNTVFISGALGMVFYWFVPVTPPRLLADAGHEFGFIDPIGAGRIKPGALANDYAAIPSYHFGWIMLSVIALWWLTGNWIVRAGAGLFLVGMTWSIVATANHYFLDMVHGGLMVLLALWLALRLERALDERPSLGWGMPVRLGPIRIPF